MEEYNQCICTQRNTLICNKKFQYFINVFCLGDDTRVETSTRVLGLG